MKKKKNLILLGVLLFVGFFIVIGTSYAYFSVIFNDTRESDDNGNTNVTTGNLSNATIVSNIPTGVGSFLSADIYPGHKEVLGLSVTGSGEVGSKSYFQFKYKVSENGLGQNVKVSVYESDTAIEIQENHFNCVKKNESIEGSNDTKYYETCEEKNVGKLLEETLLTGGSEDIVIGKDIITIQNENEDVTKYYYVVVEFVNQDSSQNEDMNRSLVGKVDVELTTPFEIPVPTYCDLNPDTGACALLLKGETDELVFDNTVDNNLRYIGANPNNYVSFNNELWRIIGVMNNIDDGTGKKESRIKLIRNESIGEYAWDTTNNVDNGINVWSRSRIMKLLNPGYESETAGGSLYWNRSSGNCYSKIGSQCYENTTNIVSCNFNNTGLTEIAKSLIGDALWNVGSNGKNVESSKPTMLQFYELERSENPPNPAYLTDITWSGKIGLMYVSDYGYATSGGQTINRKTCLESNANKFPVDCFNSSNWIYKSNEEQKTMTPIYYGSLKYFSYDVFDNGGVGPNDTCKGSSVHPTLYLKSNVKIVDGVGSEGSPFQLSLD